MIRRSPQHLLAGLLTSALSLHCGGTTAPRVLGGDSGGMDGGNPPADAAADVPPDGDLPVSICAGALYTCALGNRGGVWCWGSNASGQLAVPSSAKPLATSPTLIAGLPGGVADIACAGETVCVRTQAGRVLCWGDNSTAECGSNAASVPAEVDVPAQIDGLLSTSALWLNGGLGCALDGSALLCWGDNVFGELGNGHVPPWDNPSPQSPLGLGGVTTVALGWTAACAHLLDGTVKCWGDDRYGQFGDGDGGLSGVQTPTTAPALAGFAHVGMGAHFGCALDASQAVVCWGLNDEGELGRGSLSGSALPPGAVVGLPGPISTVATGGTVACAITAKGGLWCWGNIGQGSPGPSPVEVPVPGDVAQAAIGADHVCALATDHSVWCWGANDVGQLGLGTTSPSVPTPSRVTIP